MANNTKDLEQLIKRGRAEGWMVERTNGGHWKWWHPRLDKPIFTSGTPSDWRMIRNHEAIMARVLRITGCHHHKEPITNKRNKRIPIKKFHADSRSPVIE